MTRIGHDRLPRMIARAAIVGERQVRAGDDAFKAHQAHLLAALARRGLRHHGNCLAKRGPVTGMLCLCRSGVKGLLVTLV